MLPLALFGPDTQRAMSVVEGKADFPAARPDFSV